MTKKRFKTDARVRARDRWTGWAASLRSDVVDVVVDVLLVLAVFPSAFSCVLAEHKQGVDCRGKREIWGGGGTFVYPPCSSHRFVCDAERLVF